MNFLALAVAALIPMFVGFIWYSPALFGKVWQKELGLSGEKPQGARMALLLLLTFVFSFFIAFMIVFLAVHQTGVIGLLGGNTNLDALAPDVQEFIRGHKHSFRTFKHGLLHGIMAGLFFAFPLMAINALFAKRSWKSILIDAGYWIISLGLMGGVVCAWELS